MSDRELRQPGQHVMIKLSGAKDKLGQHALHVFTSGMRFDLWLCLSALEVEMHAAGV